MSDIRGVAGDAAGIDGRVVDGIVDTIHGPILYLDDIDRKSTRLNSSHLRLSRMPSSA